MLLTTGALGLALSVPVGAASLADQVSPGPDPRARWPLSPAPTPVALFDPPATAWSAGHRGVDLAARLGQPVTPALPGRVTFAGTVAGKGVVTVEHDGFRTTYEPVAPAVKAGAAVTTATTLGVLERAHGHCLPAACLHWGLVTGTGSEKTYHDPLVLLPFTRVRLLPTGDG